MACITILLLAGFLRCYRLDLVSVTDATGLQVLSALAALSLGGADWPLAGPPTESVRGSAFLVSGIAAASLISWHLFSGIVFVVALNLCAIALLYHLCLKQFGGRVAIMTTLLYASSPWGLLYSRLLAPSSCLAVFGIGLIYVSLRWLEEKGNKQLTMMVLLGFAIPQIHFSGVCASFWLSGVLFIWRRDVSYVSLAVGGVLGAALWIPWIAFQHLNDWIELKAWFGSVLMTPGAHSKALLQSLNYLQSMLHSSNFDYWFGGSPSQWPEYFPLWQRLLFGTTATVLSALLIVSVIHTVRTVDRTLRLLLVWITLAVLFGTVLRTGLDPNNTLIACPVVFILVGVVIGRFRERLPQRMRLAPDIAIAAVVVTHLLFVSGWARVLEDGQATSGGQFQLSYGQRQAIVQSILNDSVDGPVWIAGMYSGLNPAYEAVLVMEPGSRYRGLDEGSEPVCYWIEEGALSGEQEEAGWKARKERQLNNSMSEQLQSPPNWSIERHWLIGRSQIYRLHLVAKQPLQ